MQSPRIHAHRIRDGGNPARADPARDDGENTKTEEPRRERRRTTTSTTLSGGSSVEGDESSMIGKEEPASEDESCASLAETALSVCSQADIFD